MEQEIEQKFKDLDLKLNAIYDSVEKTRKYFKLTFWVTVIVVVLPIVGAVVAVPLFLKTYLGMISGI